MSYEDLESNDTDPTVQLNLSRIERYLNGPPTTVQSQTGWSFLSYLLIGSAL
jgi:hypothetical protein